MYPLKFDVPSMTILGEKNFTPPFVCMGTPFPKQTNKTLKMIKKLFRRLRLKRPFPFPLRMFCPVVSTT